MIFDIGSRTFYVVRRAAIDTTTQGLSVNRKFLALECEDKPHHRIWYLHVGKLIFMTYQYYKVARKPVEPVVRDDLGDNVVQVDFIFKKRA